MATSVVRNHAEAVLREEKHLAVPSVGAQRPAVRERYGRALAPVLVVDFGAVLGGDRAHCPRSFARVRGERTCFWVVWAETAAANPTATVVIGPPNRTLRREAPAAEK